MKSIFERVGKWKDTRPAKKWTAALSCKGTQMSLRYGPPNGASEVPPNAMGAPSSSTKIPVGNVTAF